MTDWSGSLARAFDTYLKIAGSSGSSGSVSVKTRQTRHLSATVSRTGFDESRGSSGSP